MNPLLHNPALFGRSLMSDVEAGHLSTADQAANSGVDNTDDDGATLNKIQSQSLVEQESATSGPSSDAEDEEGACNLTSSSKRYFNWTGSNRVQS